MYIKEAIVIGDRRKYISALIQIDYDNVGNWAQKNKIAYTTYRSLAENPQVKELIKQEIDVANEGLANVESVKKFKILEKELDQDDEELTATQKVKRKTIEKRFAQGNRGNVQRSLTVSAVGKFREGIHVMEKIIEVSA